MPRKKGCSVWFNSLGYADRVDVLREVPFDDWDMWSTPQQMGNKELNRFSPRIKKSICKIYRKD